MASVAEAGRAATAGTSDVVTSAAALLTAAAKSTVWFDEVLLANALGLFTSFLFTVLYFPQFILNHRRKSTEGFSGTGIVIKLTGAAFLAVNSWSTGEALPVIAYGALNVLQHNLFMIQFFLYERRHNWRYLMCILIPVVPYMLAEWMPATVAVTNYLKPATQVLSHIPQLLECRRLHTTAGVSLLSQHLNLLGGLLGIYMCWVIPPKSHMTWLLYSNSIGQAVTLYAAFVWYDTGIFRKRSTLLPMHADDNEHKE